jgi:hypothetical protein
MAIVLVTPMMKTFLCKNPWELQLLLTIHYMKIIFEINSDANPF